MLNLSATIKRAVCNVQGYNVQQVIGAAKECGGEGRATPMGRNGNPLMRVTVTFRDGANDGPLHASRCERAFLAAMKSLRDGGVVHYGWID